MNETISVKRQPLLWGVIAGYIGVLAYFVIVLTHPKHNLPMIIGSSLVFAGMQWLCPACRPIMAMPVCPLNLTLLLFFNQVLVQPLLVASQGASRSTLPYLPSDLAMNIALLMSTLAYIAFCGSYQYFYSRSVRKNGSPSVFAADSDSYTWLPSVPVIASYGIVGVLGFALRYGSISGYFEYIANPMDRWFLPASLSGTIRGAASTFLRPFLGFTPVIIWCNWLDRRGKSSPLVSRVLITIFLVGLATICNASFSFNRGTIVAPLVTLVSVYSAKVSRVSFKVLSIMGILLLLLAFLFGAYRSSEFVMREVVADAQVRGILVERVDLIEQIQVYGAAPQFLGYFLERSGYGEDLYWGSTLVSSLLHPIPILGKSFRPSSGVTIYNEMIYGRYSGILDAVNSFQGELFLNFHLIGVIAGFCIVGYLAFKFQRAFENAATALEAYSWLLVSLWTVFLILGSLAVVSQMYIFFFWPIYTYLVLRFAARRRCNHC